MKKLLLEPYLTAAVERFLVVSQFLLGPFGDHSPILLLSTRN